MARSKKTTSIRSAKSYNRSAHWKAYRSIEKQINTAWKKLRTAARKGASRTQILKYRNELLILLGECNYMAREYSRLATKAKKAA